MGTLYLVSTPIGNLEDITFRAVKILFSVDFIACEDTRRTGLLLNILASRIRNHDIKIKGISFANKPKLISFYDENEEQKIPEIVDYLEKDNDVALVSDSGTPLIADPGYKLVNECLKHKISIKTIPGPSSFLTALTSSGLTVNQFLFLGYLPNNKSKRQKLLRDLNQIINQSQIIKPTVIFFESPHRLKESLKDIETIFGDIQTVISRELTKVHEEIIRGKMKDIRKHTNDPKGEYVLLFSSPRE